MKEVIRVCCKNEELTRGVADQFLALESPVSVSAVEEICENATVFNMNSLMRMKDFVEKIGDVVSPQDLVKPLAYGHKMDGYGVEPHVLPKGVAENSSAFLLSYAFSYNDLLWAKVCRASDDNVHYTVICKTLIRLRESKSLKFNRTNSSLLSTLQGAFSELFTTPTEPLVALCDMLEGCQVVECRRGNVDSVTIDCARNDVVLVVATENPSRDSQIPFEITAANGKNFQLTSMSTDSKISLRHGDPFLDSGQYLTTEVERKKIQRWSISTIEFGNF